MDANGGVKASNRLHVSYALGKAQLHTETAVESVEFNEYVLAPSASQIDSSVQLIFCLKEVRVRTAAVVTDIIHKVSIMWCD